MDQTSPPLNRGPDKRSDLIRGLKFAGAVILVGVVIFRAYSAWSERRLREVDRSLIEASRAAAAEMDDEACRDAASASCRELFHHGAINGAPCAALKRGLENAREAMPKAPRTAKDIAGWTETEELIKSRCP